MPSDEEQKTSGQPQAAPSFKNDILPLFRQVDIAHMQPMGVPQRLHFHVVWAWLIGSLADVPLWVWGPCCTRWLPATATYSKYRRKLP